MCLTFKKNNKQTKKPINRFLQDDASAGIQSLRSIRSKLAPNWRTNVEVSDLTFFWHRPFNTPLFRPMETGKLSLANMKNTKGCCHEL